MSGEVKVTRGLEGAEGGLECAAKISSASQG